MGVLLEARHLAGQCVLAEVLGVAVGLHRGEVAPRRGELALHRRRLVAAVGGPDDRGLRAHALHALAEGKRALALVAVLSVRGHGDDDRGARLPRERGAQELRERRVAVRHVRLPGAHRTHHLPQRGERGVDGDRLLRGHAFRTRTKDALRPGEVDEQQLPPRDAAARDLLRKVQVHEAVRAGGARVEQVADRRARQLDRAREARHVRGGAQRLQRLAHRSEARGLPRTRGHVAGRRGSGGALPGVGHFLGARAHGQPGLAVLGRLLLAQVALAALARRLVHLVPPLLVLARRRHLAPHLLGADRQRQAVGQEVVRALLVHLDGRRVQRALARGQQLERDAREQAPVRRSRARVVVGAVFERRLRQASRRAEDGVRLSGAGLAVGHERARVPLHHPVDERASDRVVRLHLVGAARDARETVEHRLAIPALHDEAALLPGCRGHAATRGRRLYAHGDENRGRVSHFVALAQDG
mmetsp:Transcript_74148/g.179125  ORF Transcript_74148/g.179125 Transcript_74148/m.179125 type:complete len:472 (+) Transcript_74148:230-1645(+)